MLIKIKLSKLNITEESLTNELKSFIKLKYPKVIFFEEWTVPNIEIASQWLLDNFEQTQSKQEADFIIPAYEVCRIFVEDTKDLFKDFRYNPNPMMFGKALSMLGYSSMSKRCGKANYPQKCYLLKRIIK